jgi:hypothetical protein
MAMQATTHLYKLTTGSDCLMLTQNKQRISGFAIVSTGIVFQTTETVDA